MTKAELKAELVAAKPLADSAKTREAESEALRKKFIDAGLEEPGPDMDYLLSLFRTLKAASRPSAGRLQGLLGADDDVSEW